MKKKGKTRIENSAKLIAAAAFLSLGVSTAIADDVNVSTWAGLKTALEGGNNATLTDSFRADDDTPITTTATQTLNLNSQTLTGAANSNIQNAVNLTVQNGTIQGFSAADGGAIYNEGTMTITNTQFTSNKAGDFESGIKKSGGAIYSTGDLTISDSIFTSNEAYTASAISSSNANLDITDSTFDSNIAGNYGTLYATGSNSSLTIDSSKFLNNQAKVGGAINTSIKDLIVTNSTFDNNISQGNGAAISSTSTNVTLDNVDFLNNHKQGTTGYGTVYLSSNTNISVLNSTFENNTSTNSGALYITSTKANAKAEIDKTTFEVNLADTNGGALYLNLSGTGSESLISNSEFVNNETRQGGGAIYIGSNKSTIIKDSTFKNNIALATASSGGQRGQGGAIRMGTSGTISIENTDFTGNEAHYTDALATSGAGGAIYSGAQTTINGGTYDKNSAIVGGAIYNEGTLTISDATFSNNVALGLARDTGAYGVGGAIASSTDSVLSLDNVTFSDNHSKYDGGALGSYGALTINNAEFYRNTADLTKDGDGQYTVAVTDDTQPVGGGAISLGSVSSSTIGTIANTLFQGNKSGINGGAIGTRLAKDGDNSGAKLDISATFEGNEALQNGGAIYNTFYANNGLGKGDGVTVTGTFTGNKAGISGGAIYNDGTVAGSNTSGGVMTIDVSTFTENTATKNGGAIAGTGKLAVKNSTFTGNIAGEGKSGYGGAIYAAAATEINNVKFIGNEAYVGGAVTDTMTPTGKLTIINSEFTDNIARADAGALGLYNGNRDFDYNHTEITDTIFKNNRATNLTGDSDGGGAIQIGGNARAVLDNTQFIGNTSAVRGGAIAVRNTNNEVALYVEDSLFEGNKSGNFGGAIANVYQATVKAKNTEFNNNEAEIAGGAIYNGKDTNYGGGSGALSTNNGRLQLVDTTFTGNKAGEKGGAIYNDEGGKITFEGTNTFKGNTANGVANDIYNAGTIIVGSDELAGTLNLDAGVSGNGIINLGANSLISTMGNETTGTSVIQAGTINIGNGAKYELDWGDTITAATINNTDSSKLTISNIYVDSTVLSAITTSIETELFTSATGNLDTSKIKLFTSEKTYALSQNGKNLVITKTTETGGLKAAVDDEKQNTVYQFTGETTENNNLGQIAFGNLIISGDKGKTNTIVLDGVEGITVTDTESLTINNVASFSGGSGDTVTNAGTLNLNDSVVEKIGNTSNVVMNFTADNADANTTITGTGNTYINVDGLANVTLSGGSIEQATLVATGAGHLVLDSDVTGDVVNYMTGDTLVLSSKVDGDWTNTSPDSHAIFATGAEVTGDVTNDGLLEIFADSYTIEKNLVNTDPSKGILNIGDGSHATAVELATDGTISQKALNILSGGKLTAAADKVTVGGNTITNEGAYTAIGGAVDARVTQSNAIVNAAGDTLTGTMNFGDGTNVFINNTGDVTQNAINVETNADVVNNAVINATTIGNSGTFVNNNLVVTSTFNNTVGTFTNNADVFANNVVNAAGAVVNNNMNLTVYDTLTNKGAFLNNTSAVFNATNVVSNTTGDDNGFVNLGTLTADNVTNHAGVMANAYLMNVNDTLKNKGAFTNNGNSQVNATNVVNNTTGDDAFVNLGNVTATAVNNNGGNMVNAGLMNVYDTLKNKAAFTNNGNAQINATNVVNNTTGDDAFVNLGNVTATAVNNIGGNMINADLMNVYDTLTNNGAFTNNGGAQVNATNVVSNTTGDDAFVNLGNVTADNVTNQAGVMANAYLMNVNDTFINNGAFINNGGAQVNATKVVSNTTGDDAFVNLGNVTATTVNNNGGNMVNAGLMNVYDTLKNKAAFTNNGNAQVNVTKVVNDTTGDDAFVNLGNVTATTINNNGGNMVNAGLMNVYDTLKNNAAFTNNGVAQVIATNVVNKGEATILNLGNILTDNLTNETSGTITNNNLITVNNLFTNEGSATVNGNGTLIIKDGINEGNIAQGTINVAQNNAFTNEADIVANLLNNNGKIINKADSLISADSLKNNGQIDNNDGDIDTIALVNNGQINNDDGDIDTDTLTNNGIINLSNDSELNVDAQTANIAGTINVIAGENKIAINGNNQDFVGNLNIGGVEAATLNFTAGDITQQAYIKLAAGSTLNISGKDITSDDGLALVELDSSDMWDGIINNVATTGVDNSKYGLQLVGVNKTIGDGTADFNQKGGTLELIEGTNFGMLDASKIEGGNLGIGAASTFNSLGAGKVFTVDNLQSGGMLRAINGGYEDYTINNNMIVGDDTSNQADFTVDLLAKHSTIGDYDSFLSSGETQAATARGTGIVNIADWQLNGDVFGKDAPIDRTIKLQIFSDNVRPGDNIVYIATDKTVLTPIGYYGLKPSSTPGTYDFTLFDYNPQVFRGQVATVSQYMNQLVINDMLLDHTSLLSRYNDKDKMANLSASATETATAPYQYSQKDGGMWFKPYGNFETLHMTQGLDVRNNAYGALMGVDMDARNIGNGWTYIPTAYIGYNGGHQTFNGVSIYENGGQLGFMGTFYKNDFITSGLVYAGLYNADYRVAGSHESTFNYFAGAGSKTSYNWHLPADFIVQPNLTLAYNFFGKQNWNSNYGQMGMEAGFLNGINIAPGLNFIWDKETFSLYAGLNYVYNILGNVDGQAGNVDLPNVRMDKGYFQYGIGATKSFGDRFKAYGQVSFRNRGRTGVGFQAGLEWKF